MRALVALVMTAVLVVACGGGASSPIYGAPGVTSAPSVPAPSSTGGYDYGY